MDVFRLTTALNANSNNSNNNNSSSSTASPMSPGAAFASLLFGSSSPRAAAAPLTSPSTSMASLPRTVKLPAANGSSDSLASSSSGSAPGDRSPLRVASCEGVMPMASTAAVPPRRPAQAGPAMGHMPVMRKLW
ncbi:hypothetical protein BC828DRAFT_403598 [Blastocladiella britannica]|nr:hypothetical protein BC828DRAFT_403598 [Blastocladiella britannica]